MKKIINSVDAPKAIGPYSQAVNFGNLIFLSGQLPINPATDNIEAETAAEQTKTSLTNIINILKEVDCTLENVVKATVYLKDMNDFSVMNNVYKEFFKDNYPARTAFEVSELPMGALVEIEVIAMIDK